MKKAVSLLLASVLLIVTFVGCEPKGDTTKSSTTVSNDTGNADKIKVAMVLKTLSNPFWVAMADGIEAEAAKLGVDVDVFAVDSEADIDGQLKKCEDALNSGSYVGLGVAPITSTNLISAVTAANRLNIPVVNIDAKIDDAALKAAGGYIIGFATSDNHKVGAIGAQYIIDQFPNGAKVAIIEGRAGDLSGELRRDGCKETLEAAGAKYEIVDIQPADWDRQKALDVTTNIITKTQDIDAFFVANDTMALGALQAINNSGKKDDILLVGTDASEETHLAIADGSMVAVTQDPGEIGATCLRILIDAINKGETGSLEYTPVSELVNANLVTAEM